MMLAHHKKSESICTPGVFMYGGSYLSNNLENLNGFTGISIILDSNRVNFLSNTIRRHSSREDNLLVRSSSNYFSRNMCARNIIKVCI